MGTRRAGATSKQDKEALIERHLDRILEPLGYRRGDPLEFKVRADRAWWYFRRGQKFATEIIAAILQWRAPSIIVFDCFASPLQEQELRVQGLGPRTATGNSPYAYLVHVLERDQDDVLPDMIPLGDPEQWDALFTRIAGEVATLDRDFWDDYLWNDWVERSARLQIT